MPLGIESRDETGCLKSQNEAASIKNGPIPQSHGCSFELNVMSLPLAMKGGLVFQPAITFIE